MITTAAGDELSARGQAMSAGGPAPYIQAHIANVEQPGYIGLAVAENLQVTDLLMPMLQTFPPLPEAVVAYGENAGRGPLRSGIARLFERELFGRPVDPDSVQVLAGASGMLDALGHALGDPGDVVIVPTPSYAGFWPDFEVRPGMRIVTARTSTQDGFRLTTEALDRALASAGGRARVLLLTNPDNPRGQVHAEEDVEAALEWADAHGLHVIADEIYGLSVFGEGFTSVGRLRQRLGPRLHVLWAFSKDFGMSGLRCGVLITENEGLRRAVELQAFWQGVSSHTQHVLAAMLDDAEWLGAYLTTMRARLRDSAAQVVEALDAINVPHLRPQAGFFVLCDLRGWLADSTWEAEHRVWQHVMDQAHVNLTPGSALRAEEPGWFRLCYAANPTPMVLEAISRIGGVLGTMG